MISTEAFSYLFVAIGLVAAILATMIFRPERSRCYGAMGAGGFVASANFILEVIGGRLDIYHVAGALSLAGSPISLDIGWFFLGFSYCLGYSFLAQTTRQSRLAGIVYIIAGILFGCLFDYCGARVFTILRLGANGHPYMIVLVWLVMVPLTITFYLIILQFPDSHIE